MSSIQNIPLTNLIDHQLTGKIPNCLQAWSILYPPGLNLPVEQKRSGALHGHSSPRL
ncbi:MAG: hypothetical protein H6561_15240 [Lewinellaceae bacterium]|nr:hypothetical protein [Lewinellaceae bacterium]